MARAAWLALVVLGPLLSGPGQAVGGFTPFSGGDDGVGPGQASPNTNAAISDFLASAQRLGKTTTADFEGLPVGNFRSLQATTDLRISLSNTDQGAPAGCNFGVSKGADPAMFGAGSWLNYGYNTSPGGSQFLEFAPAVGAVSASARFDFQVPTHAFGVSLTGLQTGLGEVHLLFNDGTAHDLTISGQAIGGVQFFGITDSARILSVTIEELGMPAGSRDVFGMDDLRFTDAPVPTPGAPEPSSWMLAALGGAGLIWSLRRRRRRLPG
jgi:hypothetical protein